MNNQHLFLLIIPTTFPLIYHLEQPQDNFPALCPLKITFYFLFQILYLSLLPSFHLISLVNKTSNHSSTIHYNIVYTIYSVYILYLTYNLITLYAYNILSMFYNARIKLLSYIFVVFLRLS